MTIGSDSIGRTPNDLSLSGGLGVGTDVPTPPTFLHISSGVGANGSCHAIIQADEDDTVEGSRPKLFLKSDGTQTEGGLFNKAPNRLIVGNASSTAGGVGLATINTATGAESALERLLVNDSGNVGIGTPPPSPTTNQLEVDGDTKIDGNLEATGDTTLGGSVVLGARKASGAGNLVSTGAAILAVTDTSAPRTVTIQSADILNAGQIFIVQDETGGAAANNIAIATEGAETIDGAASDSITTNRGNIVMYSNGTNLIIISRK